MSGSTVVVLGGGTGGVVAARSLRRRLGPLHRVVLVDRDLTYRFAPSFLWVMTGARRPDQVAADLGRLRRRGIEVLPAEVQAIDTVTRSVRTSQMTLAYDRLVVALGAELAPEALPGFAESAHNVYTLEGAADAGRALGEFRGGRLTVLVSSLPYKCPAAPYETALLAEAVLRRHGVRDASTIEIYTPEALPMPTAGQAIGEALATMLARRGIAFHPGRRVEWIDPGTREIAFADGARADYDLLLGIPPHRPPAATRRGGLAPDGGFVPADPRTLEAAAEGVFAVGDVAQIPIGDGRFLPKAGVFAHAHAEVVARRIAGELAGRRPQATFDGKGSCFVETGDGRAAFATGEFYAGGVPRVRLHPPSRRWHLTKVAFERYWMRRWF